jgi:uncharacterized SAM-dependent methyltransferase
MEAKEKYNHEWFKNRAFNSLRKISGNSWDYSDSLLLYISSGVAVYESAQNTDTPYFKLVTKPEHEYLKLIAKDIANVLPDNFEYIDLGPGTEHKEQFLFDELKKQGKTFTYTPVDISDYFLGLAEKYATDQGIKTDKIKSSFEELPELLGKPNSPRFVSLGQTFANFDPQEILKLLINVAGKNGFVFIDAQIKNRTNVDEIRKIYQEVIPKMCADKLKLIGLDSSDVSEIIIDSNNMAWCSVIKNNKELEKTGVKEGDKLMVVQSLRYTEESLENELKKTGLNYKMFDTESPFIASIIKT